MILYFWLICFLFLVLPVILLAAKNKIFSFGTVFVLLPSEQMQFDASKLSSWRKWTNERMWLFLCDQSDPTLASTLSLQAFFSANLFACRRCFATLYPVLPYRLLSYTPPPSLPSPTLQSSKQPGIAATVDLALTSPLDVKRTTLWSTNTYSLRACLQVFWHCSLSTHLIIHLDNFQTDQTNLSPLSKAGGAHFICSALST